MPTNVPTVTPTEAPTHNPTRVPTTPVPSGYPTEVPTTLPPTTDKPSFAPTHTPTEHPTAEPTATPTEQPTAVPTASPTQEPTEEPTQEPTHVPTAPPTEAPTKPACKDLLKSDVVLMVDSSASILDSQWSQFMTFIDDVTGDFPISKEGMNVGALQFATRAYKYSDMVADKATAQAARFNMAPRGNMTLVPGAMGARTNMHLGVEEAMKIDGRNGVIDTLLVLTDGLPTGGTNKGGLADKAS